MKKAYLLLFAVVAVLLFTATNSYSVGCSVPLNPPTYNCTADKITRGECFIASSGHIVEVVRDSNGNFPVINEGGNSVFQYRIYLGSATAPLNLLDIQVGSTCGLQVVSSNPGGMLYPIAQYPKGEPLTSFGAQQSNFDVWKWGPLPSCWFNGDIFLTMQGNVLGGLPNRMLLKPVVWSGPYPGGVIIGPSCIQPPKITIPDLFIQHTTAGEMNCGFDALGNLKNCYDEIGNLLPPHPANSLTCTLTGADGTSITKTIEYASDLCQLGFYGSSAGMWVYVRGNWICKCPPGVSDCICPAR